MANADFVTRITLQNQEFQNQIQQCQNEIKRLRAEASNSNNIISALGGSLGKFGTLASGTAAVATAIVAIAKASIDAYSRTEQVQTALRGLVGEATIADALFERLRDYGNTTPYDTQGLAEAAKLMMGYGISASQVMPIMEELGDIAMGDNNKLQSLALAFSQMSAAGKVCKQDLNQMINAGFNPLQVISEQTGESIGSLFDKVSKGQISVRQIQQAFKDATSEGGKFHNMASNLGNTVEGAFNGAKDAIDTAFSSIGQLIAPATISLVNTFTSAINGLASAFQLLNRSRNGFQGYTKEEVSGYEKQTNDALNYAYSDPKKTKSRLQNGLKFEQARLRKQESEKNKADKEVAYWTKLRAKNEKELYKKDKNGKTGWTKLVEAERTSKTRSADITLTKDRVATYNSELLQAFPEQTPTPQSPHSGGGHTSKGGGGSTEKVYLQNTLAWYENEIRKAEETAASAVGQEAYKAAMATVKALEEARDNFKDGWTGAKNENVSKLKLGDSSNLTGTPNLSLPTLKDLKPLGDIIDQKQIDKINELAEAMEKARGVFESYGGDTVSLQKQIYDLADAYKLTGDSSSFAGAGMALMGQQMQALGKDGAVAKMGAVMAAIGQLILGYGEATAQAAKLGPWAWVAFAATGLATLITTISQIQSFSQGGILNGGSVAGDQMFARVNAGEMILNGSQQRKLFNMLDSNGAIGGFSGGQVEFKINGSTLKGVLRNYDNKMSIL